MIKFYRSQVKEQVLKPSVSLLGAGDGTEITQYEIGKDSMIFIKPSLEAATYEFYYIVKGSIQYKDEVYGALDYFDVSQIDETYAISAKEDTLILYVSSTKGEFDDACSLNNALVEQLENIQKKDNYTFEHCRRVKRLVVRVGEYLRLTDDEMKELSIAGYFHDVGKIRVDDQILNKAGGLTDKEYRQMKQHVVESYDIVSKEICKDVGQILLQHHERLDGSGYPKGLRAEEISKLGRILAVVDSYDAMTTDRVYKKGKSSQRAIEELLALSHQYDGEMVRALAHVLKI